MREKNESTTRRKFLAGTAGVALTGLAGCTTGVLPGDRDGANRTLYIGSYHWGFILLDETGTERDQVTLDKGSTVEIVGFGVEAHEAVESLPAPIQEGLPSHEKLESRNEERIPAPSGEYLHDALEVAESAYPDHSLMIVPAGWEQRGGGMMNGGMMGSQGVLLSQEATEPDVQKVTADQSGAFSIDCGTYCGYGHQYMYRTGAIIVE
ncbi:MAG: hypothetical protein ABEJ84_07480 [Halodesulfurarchaeum sp.]